MAALAFSPDAGHLCRGATPGRSGATPRR